MEADLNAAKRTEPAFQRVGITNGTSANNRSDCSRFLSEILASLTSSAFDLNRLSHGRPTTKAALYHLSLRSSEPVPADRVVIVGAGR